MHDLYRQRIVDSNHIHVHPPFLPSSAYICTRRRHSERVGISLLLQYRRRCLPHGLQKLPASATIHVELLQPSEEHDEYEDNFALVTPSAREPEPLVCAPHLRLQLPLAAVSCRETHVPVRTESQVPIGLPLG